MAETLRGGLSLAMSGFSFWSHDIGGFEGTPDAAVFKRWTAFGLLSSHSRFHGSSSYRVPWMFDPEGTESDPESAVSVTRLFTRLKLRLMPYLYATGLEASASGMPVMRPMALEFPDDPAVAHLDQQYMLGANLLVAPVMSSDGVVQFYLPTGKWTNYFTQEVLDGGGWRRETHGFDSLPLYVREGTLLPIGSVETRPDYDYLENLVLESYPGGEPRLHENLTVTQPNGEQADFLIDKSDEEIRVMSSSSRPWSLKVIGRDGHKDAINGEARFTLTSTGASA
jgi:alpha-D-xyloside xylohydrolase